MNLSRTRTAVCALAVLFALLAAPGCSKDDPVTPPPPTDNTVKEKIRPIVFVHGFLEAADAFSPMSGLFTLNSYTDAQVNAFDFEGCITGNTADVAKMTEQLKSKIAAVIAATGTDRVDIVAHGIGVQAVQQYLAKQNGVGSVAHVAFLGGIIDATQTVDGSLTPAPCKFITFRSNGQDATQGGDAAKGTLQGADNRQIAGLDHQQLLASSDVFTAIHTFFTGQDPAIKKLPATANLTGYTLKLRVINFFDNTPVPGANVRFIWLMKGRAERQSNAKRPDYLTDAQGYVTVVDTVNPFFDLEIYVFFKTSQQQQQYQDMHIYRQPWRASSTCERLRVMPKTGGSTFAQAIYQGIATSALHSIVILHAPFQALYSGRDQASIDAYDMNTPPDYYAQKSVDLINAATAPPPGSSAQGSNTSMLFAFDMYSDKSDAPGPIPVAALNAYLINSYDVFLNATTVSANYGILKLNAKSLAFRCYRTAGASANTGGFNLVQFDYND
jgi:pimeloyl-ACP methyl ester carboxylesterase